MKGARLHALRKDGEPMRVGRRWHSWVKLSQGTTWPGAHVGARGHQTCCWCLPLLGHNASLKLGQIGLQKWALVGEEKQLGLVLFWATSWATLSLQNGLQK